MSRKARALPLLTSDETSVSHDPAEAWEQLFGCPAPARADALIAQAVAWQKQILLNGDVSPAIARDLAAVPVRIGSPRTTSADALVENGARRTVAEDACPAPASPAREQPTLVAPARRQPRAASTRPRPAPLPPASSQLLIGTRLVKTHGGQTHVVGVTADGMLYAGELFSLLSAVAKRITGTHWNGLLFFGLRRRKTYPAKAAASG